MGNEINRILKLFADLQHGDCWIGENFKTVLQGVDARQASKNDHGKTNCTWQLVSHITYWRSRVVNRLLGSDNPPPFPDFLLPEVLDDAHWKQTLLDFEAAYHSLRNAIHGLRDDQLDKPSPREGQTYYELLLGCLQHDAYHMGQLMLLRKIN